IGVELLQLLARGAFEVRREAGGPDRGVLEQFEEVLQFDAALADRADPLRDLLLHLVEGLRLPRPHLEHGDDGRPPARPLQPARTAATTASARPFASAVACSNVRLPSSR